MRFLVLEYKSIDIPQPNMAIKITTNQLVKLGIFPNKGARTNSIRWKIGLRSINIASRFPSNKPGSQMIGVK